MRELVPVLCKIGATFHCLISLENLPLRAVWFQEEGLNTMGRRKEQYGTKWKALEKQPLFRALPEDQQSFIRELAFELLFTTGEFRQVVEICRDLSMWGEDFQNDWNRKATGTDLQGRERKKYLLKCVTDRREHLRRSPIAYDNSRQVPEQPEIRMTTAGDETTIFGMCPVASDKTICCNLHTIDAVANCPFGCSYCTIQTFYEGTVEFQPGLKEKLREIELDPDRFYHIGTGQSSDSLALGNRNGLLDDLMAFAADHPNILLEFKTKSNTVEYFLTHDDLPGNIVCSWSLNTQPVITNEEHFTASLENRLDAARTVADRGIPVAFHFHPLVHYRGWKTDYPDIAREIMARFTQDEILFITFGSVTLIKPVIRKIREQGRPTKILQMDMAPDPHGKLTISDELKISLFHSVYSAFAPWHKTVFFYLCMEKSSVWEGSLGRVYRDSAALETAFRDAVTAKLRKRGFEGSSFAGEKKHAGN